MDDLEELLGLMAAHYQAQAKRYSVDSPMWSRRNGQMIVVAEVMRHLAGDRLMLHDLHRFGYVPLTLDDLPRRVGGNASDGDDR